ncbi:DUF1380 domain-containing protein [Escherichia coli]|nr:DUF1380 domain-containing protein [Escherichia coli]
MYGTCETLCRELAAQYPGDAPLMLVVWSPEEIQALADGMDISLSDHEIRAVLARMEDIRHILRAFSLLRPGGVLVAVCLNGPRQQEKLLPFSDVREELPRGTFAYTDVPTMIIRLRA